MFRVNSSAAGGMLPRMPRKRLWFDRPAVHLTAAAERHAAIARIDPPHEVEPAETVPAAPSGHERNARRQRRNDSGRFTA